MPKLNNMEIIYCAASNEMEARKIGRVLVEEKLAGCINILPVIQSIYRWNGKIEEESESVLLVKTLKKNRELVFEKIKLLHSYDCPAIYSLEPGKVYPPYMEWLISSLD